MIAKKFTPLRPKVVLGVAAHPDDLDFCAGGVLAAYARAGAEVYYLVLTDGRNGTADRSVDPAKLEYIRKDEQQSACDTLGVKEVVFCKYPDAGLENTKAVRRDIVRMIRKVKPDVVVTWDPCMSYAAQWGMINHPDHRAAGQATLDAVYPLARDHLAFPELLDEGLEPHKTPCVLLINFNEPNHIIDVTNTFEQKLRAVAAHTSQGSAQAMVTEWASAYGLKIGVPYAESFVRIDIT